MASENPKRKLHTATPAQWRALKPSARQMRHDPTPAEDALWQALRGGKLGARFRRQHAVGRFIVDFFCPSAGLVVEVDGAAHDQSTGYDAARDRELEAKGFRVLRFGNDRVLSDPSAVVGEIRDALGPRPLAPSP